MHVLIAPDTFGGTLTAVEAAEAMAVGWRRSCPRDTIRLLPLSDGGPGFVPVVAATLGGRLVPVVASGPLGDSVPAEVLVVDPSEHDGSGRVVVAYVESAMANGLHLVPRERRDPFVTSTAGVGDLILAALAEGAQRLVIGLGGSSTNDGGAGMLERLGAVLRRGSDGSVESADLAPVRALLAGIDVVVATDVDVPLLGPRGATRGFATQKFADPERVLELDLVALEDRLASWAAAVGRGPDGRDAAVALGSGAAGGLGYALLAVGGVRAPGIATVEEIVGLRGHAAAADVVVTGEGSFDWQSLRGKVVSGVAAAALEAGRPVVIVAGRVEVGRREQTAMGVSAAFSVVEHCGSLEASLAAPAERLADLAERVAATWGGV